MACYYPLHCKIIEINGKNKIIFRKRGGRYDNIDRRIIEASTVYPDRLQCGRCLGCRLERSRQWAMRCMHEASLHEEGNAFLTLTYSDENLPYSLQKSDVQKFLKRLRKKLEPKKIRFYLCGEYAPTTDEYGRIIDNLGRAHYHVLIFGYDFPDKVFWKEKNGHKLYRSEMLEKLWTGGQSLIGTVTFESACYVARYILKKFLGGAEGEKEKHYKGKEPEFTTMSRGGTGGQGGIGKKWVEKWCKDIYPEDRVIIKGIECKPAKYYDKIFDLLNPEEFKLVKQHRKRQQLVKLEDNTQKRLITKEACKKAKLNKGSMRPLEKDI